MKVIVTGCSGFIGSHLVENLLNRKYEVIGIDKSSNKRIEKLLGNKFIKKNILKLAFPESDIFKDTDAIFHLASNSDTMNSTEGSKLDIDDTFKTTIEMLNIAEVFNIKQFVYASSSTIYGNTGTYAVTENWGPLKPVSHYGAAKLASEAFISSYAENNEMRTWILRFPNVVGPHMTHGAIYNFIKQLKKEKKLDVLGNGTQTKPYIYVKDLIDAILYIWMNSAMKVNVYNIAPTNGTSTKLKDIAEWCAKEFNCYNISYGTEPIGYKGDINTYRFNTEKLEKLGFTISLSSDDAVKKAIRECINY